MKEQLIIDIVAFTAFGMRTLYINNKRNKECVHLLSIVNGNGVLVIHLNLYKKETKGSKLSSGFAFYFKCCLYQMLLVWSNWNRL